MIKPSNGRIVWYTPRHSGDGHPPIIQTGVDPLAAMVVHVHGDRMVNLLVVDSDGYRHRRTSVVLLQDDDRKPEEGGFCAWMPYQSGQAAKAEALEAQLGKKHD